MKWRVFGFNCSLLFEINAQSLPLFTKQLLSNAYQLILFFEPSHSRVRRSGCFLTKHHQSSFFYRLKVLPEKLPVDHDKCIHCCQFINEKNEMFILFFQPARNHRGKQILSTAAVDRNRFCHLYTLNTHTHTISLSGCCSCWFLLPLQKVSKKSTFFKIDVLSSTRLLLIEFQSVDSSDLTW